MGGCQGDGGAGGLRKFLKGRLVIDGVKDTFWSQCWKSRRVQIVMVMLSLIPSIYPRDLALAPLPGEPIESTTTGPLECLTPSVASLSSIGVAETALMDPASVSDSAAESVELHQPSGCECRLAPRSVRSDNASAVSGEVGKATLSSLLPFCCWGEVRVGGDRILRDGLAMTVPSCELASLRMEVDVGARTWVDVRLEGCCCDTERGDRPSRGVRAKRSGALSSSSSLSSRCSSADWALSTPHS